MCMVVVGGSNVYGQSQTVWQFHPQVGVWRQLCSLLQPRCNGASCATPKGDLISAGGYVTGGTFVSSVEIFESRKRASRLLPPMPHGVYGGRACCLGDFRPAEPDTNVAHPWFEAPFGAFEGA